ncbi:ABC transporter ATP-binding protein [bacterium]|nr:ABC transporter ATP-binding protein [bacterium]
MTALLTANDVSFSFDDHRVLEEVSLTLHEGEFVGLIGANGSGKTTLLRLLLGLLPASGNILLCNEPLLSMNRKQIARRATMVQQDTRIDFAFTAREIVAMGRTPYLGRFSPESKADKDAIARAMRVTSTDIFSDRLITELSGGERQRVHIARAIAQETQIMLLDEPTANLDLAHQLEALHLVKDFTASGKSALAAIHDLSLAGRFCDRILLLSDKKIAVQGSPAQVITEKNLFQYFSVRARVWNDWETNGLIIYPLHMN